MVCLFDILNNYSACVFGYLKDTARVTVNFQLIVISAIPNNDVIHLSCCIMTLELNLKWSILTLKSEP